MSNWPLEDEWALVAAFIRRKETRSRDRGDASCGLVKVVDVSRFAWHKGLMYGGRGSHGEKKAKGQKHVSCSLPVWEFALGGGPGKF